MASPKTIYTGTITEFGLYSGKLGSGFGFIVPDVSDAEPNMQDALLWFSTVRDCFGVTRRDVAALNNTRVVYTVLIRPETGKLKTALVLPESEENRARLERMLTASEPVKIEVTNYNTKTEKITFKIVSPDSVFYGMRIHMKRDQANELLSSYPNLEDIASNPFEVGDYISRIVVSLNDAGIPSIQRNPAALTPGVRFIGARDGIADGRPAQISAAIAHTRPSFGESKIADGQHPNA